LIADSTVGDRVRIAIRPERLRMEQSNRPGLPARIRDIVYRGPVTHFYMDSAGGPLLSYLQNAGAQDWSVGDEVRCAWDAGSAVVLDSERP
jgi:ABC-type Fe3+/spermidine/putrescine transport system ATPase subunit